MKKIFVIAVLVLGFSTISRAQAVQTAGEVKPQVVITPQNQPTGNPEIMGAADTASRIKKECAGQGSAKCNKGGKSCCKGKTGEASANPANGQQSATGAAGTKGSGCQGGSGHKDCCKKKTGTAKS